MENNSLTKKQQKNPQKLFWKKMIKQNKKVYLVKKKKNLQ